MKENFPVTKKLFKPQDLQDNDCHCPEPDLSDDGTKCLKCGGGNPVVVEKKSRRKKKC